MLRRLISQCFAADVPIAPRVYNTTGVQRLLWEQSMEPLMEYISDIPMLYALISTSSTARSLFEDTPKRYLKMATDNMFGEIQQLVVAMLAAHSLQPQDSSVTDAFLDMHLDGYGPSLKTLDTIKDLFNALQDLYETYMAVETFTPLFAKSRIQNMYLPANGSQPWRLRYTGSIWEPDLHHLGVISQRWHNALPEDGTWPGELPLSDDESYRIKRALWRFQLYSVLFHSPGFNNTCDIALNTASAQNQPLLTDQQCRYLGKFNAWEVEEMATVYDYLLTYLEGCYDGPVTTKDIDQGSTQAEDLLADGQPTTRNDNATTKKSPSLDTPGVDQDAAMQAELDHFRRRIRYQLSRGLPFLYRFRLKLVEHGPNDYVDGFDLENHTLDVGLAEAMGHPNMAGKNHEPRYLPDIGPQWDPVPTPFGKARLPLRAWPDKPHAHISTAGWKICITLRTWKDTLVDFYASEKLQAMRAVGGIFFDGADEPEDYTNLESREDDEEEEFLWDWDDWCHFHDTRTAEFLCKVKRAVKIIARRALYRATEFVGLRLQSATELARWMR